MEGPQGRMNRAFDGRRRDEIPQEANAWQSFRGWEILFALTWTVSTVFVIVDDGHSVLTRSATVGLMVACAAGYLLLGRSAIMEDEDNSLRAMWYIALVVVIFVPASLLVSAATFGLFALCPQVFMLLSGRRAVAAILFLNLAPALHFVTEPGRGVGEMVIFTGTTLIAITYALVFGPWISRIIHQSRDRANLIKELEASRAEVARLSAESGALAERERLAGEIHDTLAQGFTSIIMLIQAAQAQPDPSRHLGLAAATARENLAEARALIAALDPAPLDGSTLDDALRRLSTRLCEEGGVTVACTIDGESRPLPPSTEVVLLRAAQEALTNVRRHAAASSVRLAMRYCTADVTLLVEDDGAGFDPSTSSGYGLRGMRARIEQQGGTLTVTSSPGRGTSLQVTI
ncbi:two-component sensor histidine kinase [Acrocarpospora pleiomorpha]|uniref:Oxygen sensor histidine kinase NreB n=2 Tax=Acrocarpospora pleiomorpha TaxID=90975 RepID=A0A5M3XNR9_9ACTN|nr:two-component sensor histidine kinase [Acrocarpospora pleiomorpha]